MLEIKINFKNLLLLQKYVKIFQMNLSEQCTQTFIEGKFKSCSKEFYRVINIAGFFPNEPLVKENPNYI